MIHPAIIYLIIYAAVLLYTRSLYADRTNTAKREASENLGRPAQLDTASWKLGLPADKNECVIVSFVLSKRHRESDAAHDFKQGTGLLAHPSFPDRPLFFSLCFKWPEDVRADGLAKYSIEHTQTGITYLKRIA